MEFNSDFKGLTGIIVSSMAAQNYDLCSISEVWNAWVYTSSQRTWP